MVCTLLTFTRRQKGKNMGSYIPNPRHVSPLAIAMFEFVGKLMGLSLRYKQSLPFTLYVRARAARLQMRVLLGWEDGSDALKLLWIGLQRRMVRPGRCVVFIFLSTLCSCCQCRPSVVWKQLLGQPLDIRDLEVLLPHFRLPARSWLSANLVTP